MVKCTVVVRIDQPLIEWIPGEKKYRTCTGKSLECIEAMLRDEYPNATFSFGRPQWIHT